MKTILLVSILGLLLTISQPATINANYVMAQMPEIPDADPDIYFGHEYGVSGIAEALLKFEINFSDSMVSKELLSSVELALSYVWDNRFEFNDNQISSWSKGPEHQSIYPGKKYGAAGIIPSFLDLYSVNSQAQWLERAISSYWQLSAEAINSSNFPNWSYSYYEPQEDGISLTDLKYGSIGILSAGIELYAMTGDQSYLDHGILITRWLESVSVEIQIASQKFQIVPWYNLDGTPGPIKTGYEWGIAGIAPIIYKLGELVNSDELKLWGLNLGQFLVSIQNSDGSWYSELNGNTHLANFDEGMAGIVFGLNELRMLSGSNIFDQSIKSAIDFLYSFFSSESSLTYFYFVGEGDEVYNNLNRGLLGVLKSLVSVYDLLTSEQINMLVSTINLFLTEELYLIFDGNDELLLMNYYVGVDELIDFSYGEGIAGLLNELIEFNSSPIGEIINVNLTQSIFATVNSILQFQNFEGYWNRQRAIPPIITSKLDLIDSDQPISQPTSSFLKTSNQSSTPFIFELLIIGLLMSFLIRNQINRRKCKN